MEYEKLFNVLMEFDFELVNHPDFREDSVREELIVPILKGLGYTANKPYQIIRSRRLQHPFVSIGSVRKNISLIPDYLLEVNGQPAWVLDAKAPSEAVTKSVHVEQAYSYAMHSEVRVRYFALCNGREFVLYSVDKTKPLLHFPLQAISLYWTTLRQYIAPESILSSKPLTQRKDLGLHLQRLGFTAHDILHFLRVPVTFIAQMEPNFFTFSTAVDLAEGEYMASFDFDESVFNQLRDKIPAEAVAQLLVRRAGSRVKVVFGDRAYLLNIACQVGQELAETKEEIFQPLLIQSVSR
jgi:hypothetical protein